MKKFLSIKQATTVLGKSDIEIYKNALDNSENRVDFLRIVGEVIETNPDDKELKELLDQMVYVLYQKSIVRKTILGKIIYAEKTYLHENKVIKEVKEES